MLSLDHTKVWDWERDKKSINALRTQRIAYLRRHWKKESSYQLIMHNTISEYYDEVEAEYPVIVDGQLFFLDDALVSKGRGFEYDGQEYHANVDHELWRDQLLKGNGWKIHHFNKNNFDSLERVLTNI